MPDHDTRRRFAREPIHTWSACVRNPNPSPDVSGLYHVDAGTPT